MATSARVPGLRGARPPDDLITLVLVGGASYVAAAVAHETIGHGLATFATGGKVLLFSSVHILTDRSTRLIDIAGPTNNLIAGALFLALLRLFRRAPLATRLFLWLAMARNLLWGTGYMLYSGVLGQGDWLSLIRGLKPEWAWLLALEFTGAATYGLSVLLAVREARSFAVDRVRLRDIIIVTYLAGGVVACAAAALDPAGPVWAITENAAPASFLAGIGLLAVPWLRPRLGGEPKVDPGDTVQASIGWIAGGVLMIVFFVAVLGPGIRV
jgi:hypothetical protein